MKLDRFVSLHLPCSRRHARGLLAAGEVRVGGAVARDSQVDVDRFSDVVVDDRPLAREVRRIVMLHKPAGYVSATVDAEHPTVVDLIDAPWSHELHVAGRLDRSSTGLVLLTNDGRWSGCLTDPEKKVPKVYLVETAEPIGKEAVDAFLKGFYFPTERITTLPSELVVLAERRARVTLYEGRYHQIKRMFHRVGNRVVSLHRERIGEYRLGEDLAPGAWRLLPG